MTGRIGQAVDLLNAHYPNVLAPPPPPLPASTAVAASTASVSSKSAFARPLAASKSSTPSSCTPQTFFVAPSPTPAPPPHRASPVPHLRPSSFSPSHSTSAVTGAQFGSWASSLAPEIISLNLQTQTFIELMRTAHATSAISTPSTPTSSVHGGLTGGAGGGGDAHSSDAEMSASTSSLGGSASILNVAIAQSQALREKVLQLPVGKDREGWERECIDVCGLLAYKDLATCPVRGYLSQSRRDILAEMVNSAILRKSSSSARANLIGGTCCERNTKFELTPMHASPPLFRTQNTPAGRHFRSSRSRHDKRPPYGTRSARCGTRSRLRKRSRRDGTATATMARTNLQGSVAARLHPFQSERHARQ